MSGINANAQTNPADYLLGRGRLYAAPLTSGNIPGPYRFLGNVSEMTSNLDLQKLTHFSSQHGLKVSDAEVVISQTCNLAFTMEEINAENLALFFSGTAAAGVAADNSARTGFTDQIIFDPTSPDKVLGGRWYDIRNGLTGARAYDLNSTGTVIKIGATALVVNTDYTLDNKMGTVYLLNSATVLAAAAGDNLTATITANATAKLMDEVKGLTQTNQAVALKFIGENANDSDRLTEYQIHKIKLKASGDFAMISDEFTNLKLEGATESNTTADADSPYITIRSNPTL